MKFKYIFAALALSLAVACQQEPICSFSEIQVSESYVSIDVNGGSTTIELTAGDSWQVDAASVPEWLTISPMSGTAGEGKLTFSAAATTSTQTAEVKINCGGRTQYVNVIQFAEKTEAPISTVAEINAGENGKIYRAKGTVTRIMQTVYGNWYLQDETGELYIYGTLDAKGNTQNFSSLGLEVGDIVMVEGPKTTYNGTVELVDVTVISIEKSLIKVDSIDPEDGVIPSKGGDVTVKLDNKGDGLYVEVPAEAKSWLSISSLNGSSVTFSATENTGGLRSADLVFSTTDGSGNYTAQVTISQNGATGTFDLPFSVTEAIQFVKEQGGTTAGDCWVKGIVSKIADKGEFGSYGNGTFWISEDGEYHDDLDLDFEAYRVYWFNNEKWVEGNAQIAVGTEVIICGKLTVYGSTAETVQNEAYVYSVNGVTTDAEGIGTLADPFTAKGAVAAANSVGSVTSNFKAYIHGKVANIVNNGQFSAEYGNGTFWISEDGSYSGDKSVEFEAFRVLWLGNRKWVDGDPTIAVGDDVVLYGPVTLYNGTAETAANAAYVYSYNGKTE